jgi:uncharacterized membrane protein YkoI
MPVFSRLAFLLIGLSTALWAAPAPAAELPHHAQLARYNCLSKSEQRAAVASHRAVSLAHAIRSARKHHRKKVDVVGARLCRRGSRLVYTLTLLAPNGKVTRVTVDARNGVLIKGR